MIVTLGPLVSPRTSAVTEAPESRLGSDVTSVPSTSSTTGRVTDSPAAWPTRSISTTSPTATFCWPPPLRTIAYTANPLLAARSPLRTRVTCSAERGACHPRSKRVRTRQRRSLRRAAQAGQNACRPLCLGGSALASALLLDGDVRRAGHLAVDRHDLVVGALPPAAPLGCGGTRGVRGLRALGGPGSTARGRPAYGGDDAGAAGFAGRSLGVRLGAGAIGLRGRLVGSHRLGFGGGGLGLLLGVDRLLGISRRGVLVLALLGVLLALLCAGHRGELRRRRPLVAVGLAPVGVAVAVRAAVGLVVPAATAAAAATPGLVLGLPLLRLHGLLVDEYAAALAGLADL